MPIMEITVETLAERYATLKLQASKLDKELKHLASQILVRVTPGDNIETPEYKLTCLEGTSRVSWTEAGKAQQKVFEKEMIARGFMERRTGDPYLRITYRKVADLD